MKKNIIYKIVKNIIIILLALSILAIVILNVEMIFKN